MEGVQPLLVTLETVDEVKEILDHAKNLRQSTSLFVRQNVYMNKHLTKAEALAAYNARVKRRNSMKKQRGTNQLRRFEYHEGSINVRFYLNYIQGNDDQRNVRTFYSNQTGQRLPGIHLNDDDISSS